MQRIGLIIAAGRGCRMGRTKQLVSWPTTDGEKPLVAAAFDAIASVCDAMIVVLGHEAELVAAALGERSFQRVLCDPDAQMFDSIRSGLVAASRLDMEAGVLLQPGDHPEVAPQTVEKLLAAAEVNLGRAILPEYDGRGGHPLYIPAAIVKQLLSADCPHGLSKYWSEHPELCLRLAVDDARVVIDVDTPDQIRRV